MAALTPEQRVLRASAASHASWANTDDRAARTANGTAAFLARFERQVDPDGILDPAERARRAESAKSAYMRSLQLKSSKARGRRKPKAPADTAASSPSARRRDPSFTGRRAAGSSPSPLDPAPPGDPSRVCAGAGRAPTPT